LGAHLTTAARNSLVRAGRLTVAKNNRIKRRVCSVTPIGFVDEDHGGGRMAVAIGRNALEFLAA
jgi:hypothetical protein